MNDYIINFIQGGVAGVVSRTITSPFERLKILQQNYPSLYNRGVYVSFSQIYRTNGLIGLYRGNLTNCVRIFPQNAIQYSIFKLSKNNLQRYITNQHIIHFISGSIGGVVSYSAIYPLETVRSKLSVQKDEYRGIYDCLSKTTKKYGIFSLYKGIGISALGFIPFQGSNFLTYFYLKKYNTENNIIKSMLFGSISGFVSVSLTYPFDTIKRRLQLSGEYGNPMYKNTLDCCTYIMKHNGLRGFYRGLFSCYLKIIPANGIYFMIIDLLKT